MTRSTRSNGASRTNDASHKNGSRRTKGASTQSVHAGRTRRQPHNSLTTPVVQTATYTFENTAALVEFMQAKTWGDGI